MSPTSHTITVGTLDVHYLEQGSGTPLLLLHGGTATADSWSEQLPRLERFTEELNRIGIPRSGIA